MSRGSNPDPIGCLFMVGVFLVFLIGFQNGNAAKQATKSTKPTPVQAEADPGTPPPAANGYTDFCPKCRVEVGRGARGRICRKYGEVMR